MGFLQINLRFLIQYDAAILYIPDCQWLLTAREINPLKNNWYVLIFVQELKISVSIQ